MSWIEDIEDTTAQIEKQDNHVQPDSEVHQITLPSTSQTKSGVSEARLRNLEKARLARKKMAEEKQELIKKAAELTVQKESKYSRAKASKAKNDFEMEKLRAKIAQLESQIGNSNQIERPVTRQEPVKQPESELFHQPIQAPVYQPAPAKKMVFGNPYGF